MVKNMKRYMKVSERCDVAVQINDMIRQDKIDQYAPSSVTLSPVLLLLLLLV
jgi:hypothetical protein